MRESLNDNRKEKNGEREREREREDICYNCEPNEKSKIITTAKPKRA